MFFFNTVRRAQPHAHLLDALPRGVDRGGLDHCFDCASEVHILARFLRARARGLDAVLRRALQPEAPPGRTAHADAEQALAWQVLHMSHLISAELSRSGRTLRDPDPPHTDTYRRVFDFDKSRRNSSDICTSEYTDSEGGVSLPRKRPVNSSTE
eukprot:gnl/Chilomastix_cuspidata/7601.p1 GENE.gnl/Chilomastix_cuspidata/7601~~gnl/Chilomastix_cuspidata/7601.p1  ORF type:complete len:154 (-),score=44.79 gnl/Chilomastix_cuspidata/7601:82-543(-)